MRLGYNGIKFVGAIAVLAGLKVYTAIDNKAKDDARTANAHNYAAYSTAQKSGCETDMDLTAAQCACLFQTAADYSPSNPQPTMPTFAGKWEMTGLEIMAIPAEATTYAMFNGSLRRNISNMMDADGEDMSSSEKREVLSTLADLLRAQTVELASGRCLNDDLAISIGQDSARYGHFERYMSESWNVATRRTELIADGKLPSETPPTDIQQTETPAIVQVRPPAQETEQAAKPASPPRSGLRGSRGG